MGKFFGPTANPISGAGFFHGSAVTFSNKWTTVTTGFENDANAFSQINYLNGHWVISGFQSLSQVVFVSADGGATWVKNSVATTAAAYSSAGAAFGAGTYVYVVGTAASAAPLSFTSPDLATWTPHSTGFSGGGTVSAPVFGNGVFVLTLQGHADYATSADGITWTHHNAYVPTAWGPVIFDGTRFVAGVDGVSATSKLAVSTDGINWTESAATLTVGVSALANQGATQYVCGQGGNDSGDSVNGALTTATAITFSDALHQTQALQFGSVRWTRCNGLLNTIQSSANGLAWSADTVPSAGGGYLSIGFNGGNKFIAVGFGNITNNFAATRLG